MPYREKKIYSGKMLEIEIYYIPENERKKPRKEKEKESSKKQKNLNDKNAKKKFIRLIHTNFTDKDLSIHLTYAPEYLPNSYEEAKRNETNYFRRIKNYRKKHGLSPVKYVAVIEYHNPDNTDKRKKTRIHHHIIMSDLDRDIAEQLWKMGRANADRLKADDNGYEGLARYLLKDPQGTKRWSASKNLKQPIVRINDYKFSKKKTDQLAMFLEDRELFEKLYPGYTYAECKAKFNEITANTQVYIKMRKKETQKTTGKEND